MRPNLTCEINSRFACSVWDASSPQYIHFPDLVALACLGPASGPTGTAWRTTKLAGIPEASHGTCNRRFHPPQIPAANSLLAPFPPPWWLWARWEQSASRRPVRNIVPTAHPEFRGGVRASGRVVWSSRRRSLRFRSSLWLWVKTGTPAFYW